MRRDEQWRSLRAAWAPLFVAGSLEKGAGIVSRAARLLGDRLAPAAAAGDAVDLTPLLGDYSLQVISEVALGCAAPPVYFQDLGFRSPS